MESSIQDVLSFSYVLMSKFSYKFTSAIWKLLATEGSSSSSGFSWLTVKFVS